MTSSLYCLESVILSPSSHALWHSWLKLTLHIYIFNSILLYCNATCKASIEKCSKNEEEWKGMQGCQCQKPQKLGVRMAVCKQDKAYKDYTSNPIPTSFWHPSSGHTLEITRKQNCVWKSIAISISLYILENNFILINFFCYKVVHHKGGYCSCMLVLVTSKQISDHRQPLLCIRGWEQEGLEHHHLENGLTPQMLKSYNSFFLIDTTIAGLWNIIHNYRNWAAP